MIRSFSEGSHFSSSDTLPWTTATVIGSPDERRARDRMRATPQAPSAITSSTVAASGTYRREVLTTNAYAAAALTAATSIDRPYTPTRLAVCTIGSTRTWLVP